MADSSARDVPPLLIFADDWGRHPSSCQHLARRLREDFPILWANSIGTRRVKANAFTVRRVVEKLGNWRRGLHAASERMWVIDLPMLPDQSGRIARELNRRFVGSRLNRALSRLGMERPIVLTTLPYVTWIIRDVPRRGLVYYCTDNYSHWPSADRELLERADRELADRADMILPVSRALLDRHEGTGRCHYFPHAVDFDHFASTRRAGPVDPEVARLPRPRIGFFGLIYEQLDFGLLAEVARRFRDASLVMIGPVAHCPEEFRSLENVHLLGKSAYGDLPRKIAGLDVLLLPYRDDEMIRQSSPLKLRECLATGKPTVSVDVPEVRVLRPHVRVAANRHEFVDQVGQALGEPLDSPSASARQRAVEQDRWECRAESLRGFLRELGSRDAAGPAVVRGA